jgi:hypothetical protein
MGQRSMSGTSPILPNGPLVATSSRTVSAAHVRDIRERVTFPRASVGSPAVRRTSTFGDNFAAAGISSYCLAGVVGLGLGATQHFDDYAPADGGFE